MARACYALITPRRALVSLQGALRFHKTAVSSAGVSQVRQFRCFFREKAGQFTEEGSVLLKGALDQDGLKTSSCFAWSGEGLRGAGCGLGGVAWRRSCPQHPLPAGTPSAAQLPARVGVLYLR